jgi:hypothetical protein
MGKVDRSVWPFWVRIGLWGLPTRAAAWAFFWLSIAIAVGCVAYALVDRRYLVGGILALAALWYYLSIRWVDKHSRWV